MTSVLLHARLLASQEASAPVVNIDAAIETAVADLRRIERGIIWGRNPPGELTLRKVEGIASRLLQAAEAYRLAAGLPLPAPVELPSDCEPIT